nr:hypothetical protein [uncultured archaeon]
MELKKYQEKSLEILDRYLKELNDSGPKRAFIYVANNPYNNSFFGEIPCICVKIPTGGGKTLVGCHAVTKIMEITLKNKMDKGIAMWFVPSEAIKSQTLRKLKDRNDMHRKILDSYFDNGIRVFSNEEALKIKKEDIENNLCIVVSNLDAFRKDKRLQSNYKVYQESGNLMAHFQDLGNEKFLEKDEHGTIINSLANVIRLNNPLIVIDEGHRAKTELSIDFLKDLSPCFIIEFTATPRPQSNILVDIHSAELKEEKMVKIPIILESVSQWQQAVTRGILKRNELENLAKKETRDSGDYIRPIALLQAEQEKEGEGIITVGKIKEFLIKEHKIDEEEIAIKTSSKNDLEAVNLFSKRCKIRYIITVNALAEGWDCSFAYLLISVANIGSKISVEQIIGRIVRLPYAKERKIPELNNSYIFASAKNFNEAANNIISGLEKNGYSKTDLINASDKNQKYEFEISRRINEDFSVPVISFEDEPLEFGDLIGEDYIISKENPEFKFETHYDNDGRVKLDILEGDKWIKERQTTLQIVYKDKNFSEKELVLWLDKKLRFHVLDKADKIKFIEKIISYQLKAYSLSELSINRFVLRDKIEEFIEQILIQHAKKKFNVFANSKKISVRAFDKFPDKIIVSEKTNEKFKNNYYEEVGKLNSEELAFIERLDAETMPNLKFWLRNWEKNEIFYIQGWKPNKFYADFLALTKKGNILAIEWKGRDRASNEDTDYKNEAGKMWEKLGNEKLHFFLVHLGNVEEVLNKIKQL